MNGIRLKQDENGQADIELSGGSMAVGEVTEQNMWLLLETRPGDWKEWPLAGCGIGDLANDHDREGWKRDICEALEEDGMTVEVIELTENKLRIEAKYRQ